MPATLRNFTFRLILGVLMLAVLTQAQEVEPETVILNRKIDKLTKMLSQLKKEQGRSSRINVELDDSGDYSKRDSLRLISLKRKQAESRSRIDDITLEIINLSKQLEDPRKRYALARKIQEGGQKRKLDGLDQVTDSSSTPDNITARSIDLAAVKLVRQGKSLDQARLLTIDELSHKQVLAFYRALEKDSRYELYDIADEIADSEGVGLQDARRSAIYFYLFTK